MLSVQPRGSGWVDLHWGQRDVGSGLAWEADRGHSAPFLGAAGQKQWGERLCVAGALQLFRSRDESRAGDACAL